MANKSKSKAGVIGEDPAFDWGAPMDEFDKEIGNPIGGGIELPFFVPFLSWRNGEVPFKQHPVKGAYTGAWSAWVEAIETWEGEYGFLPSNFQFAEGLAGGKAGEYNAYLAQWLPVAIIGERTRWITKPGSDKKSSHTQVLAYAAYIEEQTNVPLPYAPVVLTVKGWQSDHLKKSIKAFEAQSMAARREAGRLAGRDKALHPSMFWIMLGVTGKDRNAAAVGGGKDQSDITPITLVTPQNGYDLEALKHFYIGREVALELVRLKSEASEWLNDTKWKSGQTDDARAGNGEPEAPPPAGEDDFPF